MEKRETERETETETAREPLGDFLERAPSGILYGIGDVGMKHFFPPPSPPGLKQPISSFFSGTVYFFREKFPLEVFLSQVSANWFLRQRYGGCGFKRLVREGERITFVIMDG